MIVLAVRWLWRKYKARGSPPAVPPIEPSESSAGQVQRKNAMRQRLTLMAALAIPVFLETLDYTVVATAQPHIASAFNSLNLQSYIGTVYLLTSSVFLPLFASLADVYGRYWTMQVSLLFFLFGSALSTGAVNMPMMLAGRGVAGVGAAGLLTVVRIILADSASLDDNNWQASILVSLYAIGFSVGPVIGGSLTAISFRWIFAINLPCCTVSIALAFLLLRKITKGAQPPRRRYGDEPDAKPTQMDNFLRIDWISASCFAAGGILLLLGLNWGSEEGWKSARVVVSLVIGAVLAVACPVWEYALERRQRTAGARAPGVFFRAEAMIPISVLTSYDVCATQFAAFTSGMVMLVIFYFIAIFMVIVTGLSAKKAGVQLIYFAPGMGAGTIIAINMIKYLRQPKYPIVVGSTLIPIALGLISWAINRNEQHEVNGFMVMTGVGVGMSFGPLAIHARFSQPEERVAIVVALNLFFRSFGGTVGLAQCATIMNAKVRAYFAGLPPGAAGSLAGIHAISASSLSSLDDINKLPPEVQTLVKNAFRNGVRWSFISLIPWCGLSLLGCLFLSKIPDTDRGGSSDVKEKCEAGDPAEVEGAAGHAA